MSTSSARVVHASVVLAALFVFMFGSTFGFERALAQGLGKPIAESDIAAWDISVLPDGTGLPAGSGTPEQGATIFATKCAACHGEHGKGGVAAAVGGGGPVRPGIETTTNAP